MPFRVVPILLISNDGVVKTKNFSKSQYIGDPLNIVKIFNEKGVDELIILDINATKNAGINFSLIEEIASEAFIPLTYGGGISCIEDVSELFKLGIEKISLNNAIFSNFELLQNCVISYGAQSVVASLDVKKTVFGKYRIYSYLENSYRYESLSTTLSKLDGIGVGELLINDVSRDGTLLGYDHKLTEYIFNNTNLPLLHAGGLSSLSDLKYLRDLGYSAGCGGGYFVFNGKKNGVLITYPSEESLTEYIGDRFE